MRSKVLIVVNDIARDIDNPETIDYKLSDVEAIIIEDNSVFIKKRFIIPICEHW